jgi:hypothetical protein
LTWKVCPATLHPWKGVCAWLTIIGTAIVIVDTNLIIGICSFVFLLITLAPFIFPSTFTINAEGILANYPLHKKYYSWRQIKKARFLQDSCALFHTRNRSWITGSGMHVLFGTQSREITPAIKTHLAEDVIT